MRAPEMTGGRGGAFAAGDCGDAEAVVMVMDGEGAPPSERGALNSKGAEDVRKTVQDVVPLSVAAITLPTASRVAAPWQASRPRAMLRNGCAGLPSPLASFPVRASIVKFTEEAEFLLAVERISLLLLVLVLVVMRVPLSCQLILTRPGYALLSSPPSPS